MEAVPPVLPSPPHMPSARPTQAGLFEEAAADAAELVSVDILKTEQSPEQRRFNRLTKEIRKKRKQLADWQTYLHGYAQRAAQDHDPLADTLRDLDIRIMQRLDGLLDRRSGERLDRRQHEVLRGYLLERLEKWLLEADPPDPELEAMYNRHASLSLDERRRIDREIELDLAQTVFGAVFGEDVVAGHQGEDTESLFRHVDEKLGAKRQEQEDGSDKRRTKRAEAAAARRAAVEREASQSVRQIFRKLASALHPDRETDPAERERKTALMARVNQAYAKKDLLQLLSLQIEIEQIDAEHLAGTPEARLKQYNSVLREQSQSLDSELHALVVPITMNMNLGGFPPRMAELDKVLNRQIATLRRWCREAEAELRALDDPAQRTALLDTLEVQQLSGLEPRFPNGIGDFGLPWDTDDESAPPPFDWPPPREAGAGQEPGKKRRKRKKKTGR
ncbi:MAG TPA: J domain-containing protein [Rhodanobacter sp.]